MFKLSPSEALALKGKIRSLTGYRFGPTSDRDLPFACEVAGIKPYDPEMVTAKLKAFNDLVAQEPKESDNHPKWVSDLQNGSILACVINGLQMNWSCQIGKWNVPYITQWWATHGASWDTTKERAAGGLNHAKDMESQQLTLTGGSSIMAMISHCVGHVVRTGEPLPEELKRIFGRIRITLHLGANGHEIGVMGVAENIEQFERKRHTEMDNMFQVRGWMESMPGRTSGKLDNKKAIDVVKYALALGNPVAPHITANWLRSLLQDRPPTFLNKIDALCVKGVNKKFFDMQKVKIQHPEMNSYQRVVTRVRALIGFTAWDELHTQLVEEMGRQGYSNLPLPIPSTILLDPALLLSDAFANECDKKDIPLWRDGDLGRTLHKSMVEVARCRAFDWGYLSKKGGSKALFTTANAWVAFARLCGPPNCYMDMALERHFEPPRDTWPDNVKAIHRGIWCGEYDNDIVKMCSMIHANCDNNNAAMVRRVLEMFTPITQLLHAKVTEAQQMVSIEQKKKDEIKKKEELLKKSIAADVSDVPEVTEDGDVTDAMFKGQDPNQKTKSVNALNREAAKKRDKEMEKEMMKGAAMILRNRVVVVDSVESAKAYMESSSKQGLKARIAYVDVTMDGTLQVKGKWAKQVSHQPGKQQQIAIARHIKTLPMTAITGSTMIRHAHHNLEDLHNELNKVMGSRRSIFVPIDIPPEYERVLKSAAARALGPMVDMRERSGIEFTTRTVGCMAMGPALTAGPSSSPVRAGVAAEDDGDENLCSDHDGNDEEDDELDNIASVPEGTSIEQMTSMQLKQAFGRSSLRMIGALFQHSSKVTAQARFMEKSGMINTVSDSGRHSLFRKGQLHPTAVYEAIKSVMSMSATGIGNNDCFVQISGGTPEGVVAAIMMGFGKVIYIACPKQISMMDVPSEQEEITHNIDYSQLLVPTPCLLCCRCFMRPLRPLRTTLDPKPIRLP